MEEEDIFALAQTLWGEARGEDDEGMTAVCCTVINRFNSGKWYAGKTIEETCKKPWQYSCWNDNDPNKAYLLKLKPEQLEREYSIINKVVSGIYNDVTCGATHYYNPKACKIPKWAVGKVPCYVHGRHLFFKNID